MPSQRVADRKKQVLLSPTGPVPPILYDEEDARVLRESREMVDLHGPDYANDVDLSKLGRTDPNIRQISRNFEDHTLSINYASGEEVVYECLDGEQKHRIVAHLLAELQAKSPRQSALTSRSVEPPDTEKPGPTMQRETTITVEGNHYKATTTLEADRYVFKGVTYVPFPLAAAASQTTEKSLRDWIRKDIRFNGKPIRTHREPLTGKLYVSEESIQRVVNRFIKWPSKEPAEAVTIGTTDDESGFLPMSDAAGILGISARTMWLWTTQGKAPTEKPLDVVKCTTSDYFYVREKDVYELKALIPRSGLQRGRRPQPALKQ